jgi:hypothetical protein
MFEIENGLIVKNNLWSDAMDTQWITDLQAHLNGIPGTESAILQRLKTLDDPQHADELAQLITAIDAQRSA